MSPPGEARRSFDAVADVYDRIRPSYPGELFDELFRALPPSPAIIEVGPGTGQATGDLLARGATVWAVELGPSLASVLRAKLPSERLRVEVGDFESVPAPGPIADAVFSATAYHWISPRAQTDRPAALLRAGGIVAIVDVIQVDSPEDQGFFAAAQPIYERHGEGHTGPPAPPRGEVDPPIRAVLAADSRFRRVEVRRYDWDQTYRAADYQLLMRSYSGTQQMEPTRRESLLTEIGSLITTEFGGVVTRPLVVTLTTATLARADA